MSLAIEGAFFYAPSPYSLALCPHGLILVDDNGIIESVHTLDDKDFFTLVEKVKKERQYVRLSDKQFLMPGFVDTHIHAPQFTQAGMALDKELSSWLSDYTFPLESRFSDEEQAQKIYTNLVRCTLANGTTTAQYFGSVSNVGNRVLAHCCKDFGQRAFIGKVAMDIQEQCPPYYRDESPKQAIADTVELIEYLQTLSKNSPAGLYGVVTPRFVPTCSDALLKGLGEIAKQYDAPIQTHCSESDWEHTFVKERFSKNDAQVLHDFNLLTEKTTLAHSIFLEDEDRAIIREQGANLSHCPISNVLFANAILPLRRRLEENIKISLASDVAGGYSPSLFDAMRQTILSSRQLEEGVDYRIDAVKRGRPRSCVDFKTAIYLATTGGAEALHIQTGQFKKDYIFDALIIDTAAPHSNIYIHENDTMEDKVQKIVFLATRVNIHKIWVHGKEIKNL